MNAVALLVALAIYCVVMLHVLWGADASLRHAAWLNARDQRQADRVYEDFCWRVWRADAVELAMAIAFERADEKLLRDLGIALASDGPTTARRHLEAVS